MKGLLSRGPFLGLLLSVAVAQQSPVTITGTVVNAVTGQPIPGALVVVSVFEPQAPEPRQAPQYKRPDNVRQPERRLVTGDAGEFSFPLPSERAVARISTTRRGYCGESGVPAVNTSWPDYGAGQRSSSTTTVIKMLPMGVITGRIVFDDGEGVPGLSVEAIRITVNDGRRVERVEARKTTDDQGSYRLWDLTPGNYYLRLAGKRGTTSGLASAPRWSLGDESYGPLYFPSSPESEGAQVLRVIGNDNINADFTVAPAVAYRITGRILPAVSGQRVNLRLIRNGGSYEEVGVRTSSNLNDSTFEVVDVPPGSYLLQAYMGSNAITFGETAVNVGRGDVLNVAVTLSEPSPVTGKAEGMTIGVKQQVIGSVFLNPLNRSRLPIVVGFNATVLSDGAFSFPGVYPGQYYLTANFFGEYLPEEITSGQTDLRKDPLTVHAGTAPEPIRIRMTKSKAMLTLKLDEESRRATSTPASAFILPKGGHPESLHVAQIPLGLVPAFEPQFPLPPGDYLVWAMTNADQFEFRNPKVLELLAGSAMAVTLANGDDKSVTLKIVDASKLAARIGNQ